MVSPALAWGCGSSEDTLKKLLADFPDVLSLLVQALARGPGGANNPHGCKGKPEEDAGTESGINHDNVMVDSTPPTSPPAEQGNATAYAIRRLSRERPAPPNFNQNGNSRFANILVRLQHPLAAVGCCSAGMLPESGNIPSLQCLGPQWGEGKSQRRIADEEGVGETQVRRDLGCSTAPGGAVEQPARVTGLDGRSHPATPATPEDRQEHKARVNPRPRVRS